MRWIFITLAVVNLLVLAWGMVSGSEEQVFADQKKLKNPYGQYPEIALLSEILTEEVGDAVGLQDVNGGDMPIDSVSAHQDEVEDVSVSGNIVSGGDEQSAEEVHDPHAGGGKLLCELVGPFESSGVASDFVERLKAIEVGASVRDIELPAGAGYWVYLEPKPTRREALRVLSELQSKRIDSYVIPKGELENGISLGMFSKKTLSDARVKEMVSIGLEPLVEEIERSYREIWVMLNAGADAKMSSLSWQRAMEGIKGLERRQNYCLDVASQ